MILCITTHGYGKIFEGTVRGLGKQVHAAFVLLICFYVVSIPLTSFFVFKKGYELKGVWLGPLIGSVLEVILYIILLGYRFDWVKICKEIHEVMLKA